MPSAFRPSLSLSRRAALLNSAAALTALALPGSVSAQNAAPTALQAAQAAVGDGQPISRDALLALARETAAQPYQAAKVELPKVLSQLPLDLYGQIEVQPHGRLWDKEGRGFIVEPRPAGAVFQTPVAIRTVDNGVIRTLEPQPGLFSFGSIQGVPPDIALAFSGLRLSAPFGENEQWIEAASFQGASYFRSRARWQRFGQVARGLALNVGEAKGEETPDFRQFWVERPSPGSSTVVVHALLESESVAGLYRIAIRPGDMTVFDIECNLFPRADLANVGLAPLSGMFLFAPNDRNGFDDYRGAVHDADALQMWTGAGEWVFRPLSNPETLQISAFVDKNPKGFGLMQRERRFMAYEDAEARFDHRPSVWVEPLGEWGEGQVQLFEIPSQEEIHRNIVAYWRPKAPLAKGSEHSFTYRLYWGWQAPERTDKAMVLSTRVGKGSGKRRRFIVDFTSEELAKLPLDGLNANLSTSKGKILQSMVMIVPENKGLRVSFDLDPEGNTFAELRLVLERDNKPVSETWLYRWTP